MVEKGKLLFEREGWPESLWPNLLVSIAIIFTTPYISFFFLTKNTSFSLINGSPHLSALVSSSIIAMGTISGLIIILMLICRDINLYENGFEGPSFPFSQDKYHPFSGIERVQRAYVDFFTSQKERGLMVTLKNGDNIHLEFKRWDEQADFEKALKKALGKRMDELFSDEPYVLPNNRKKDISTREVSNIKEEEYSDDDWRKLTKSTRIQRPRWIIFMLTTLVVLFHASLLVDLIPLHPYLQALIIFFLPFSGFAYLILMGLRRSKLGEVLRYEKMRDIRVIPEEHRSTMYRDWKTHEV